MRQMSIFEVVDHETRRPIEEMTVAEVAEAIGSSLDLAFVPDTRWNGEFNEFIASPTRNSAITVGICHYKTDDERNGKAFISVEWSSVNSGFGAPCDSIDEAIRILERYRDK